MERRDQWALKILKWDDPVIALSNWTATPSVSRSAITVTD
jgi:hypothetical protein